MDKGKFPFKSEIAGLLKMIPQRWQIPSAITFLAVFFVGIVMFAANQVQDFFNEVDACDVTLFGKQANIVGRPTSVTFKALGPGVESISVSPADRRKMAVFSEVKVSGGKAVSVSDPHGQYEIYFKAGNPNQVVLKAMVECDD